jgi:hypothetical protein
MPRDRQEPSQSQLLQMQPQLPGSMSGATTLQVVRVVDSDGYANGRICHG